MDHIIIERKEAIIIAALNKPETLNALDGELMGELEALVDMIEEDKALRVLILTGSGKSFVAGADIRAQSVLDTAGGRAWGQRGSALFRRIENLAIPTIAAVNGFALGGGCELALACDMIIASEKARFGQPEVGLGITPGFSGTQRLPRRVGMAKAKELIFTGDMISAEEAKNIGLVNRVVAPEELMKEAMTVAEKIAGNAPIAVQYSKVCIEKGMQTDMDAGIAIENELFALTFGTEDQKAGMTAFLEKRKAEFKGE